ncbi:MAG: MATE family efflux transporter [Bacteroidales bacterium]
MTESNNKRIAKNTLLLYVRTILTLLVSLYTSRVVLEVLGVVDFGIYNVVGGFVTMFTFLNGAMSAATQRFLSFEIGKGNQNQLRNVFGMSVNIHLVIAAIIFILAETVGLWFVVNKLVIPSGRFEAAMWVYQLSILSLMVGMLSVPYNALIISHERMGVFAYVSIFEVALKLLIVFMLQWFSFDKLKLYAALVFLVSIIVRLIYGVYCNRQFKETRFHWFWDSSLFKTLASYAGWNLWGSFAVVAMGQGVNVLLNIFFGPMVNAARGIAFQVKSAVIGFVQNFQMAMNPPIVKSYASGNQDYMFRLVSQGAKLSYFMLLVLSTPIFLETEFILQLWLKQVPEYTVVFVRLILIGILIDSISGTLMTAVQAVGKIKVYQSVVGGLLILNLPVSYLALKLGREPESTLIVSISISLVALIFRLFFLKKLINFDLMLFAKNVLLRIVLVMGTLILICLPFLWDKMNMHPILSILLSGVTTCLLVYFLGATKEERTFVRNYIKKLVNNYRKS